MMTRNDYKQIVQDGVLFIDVRAPLEFDRGKLMGAVNLPIMTNEERHEIGIMYKESGSEAATELGHDLICKEVKEARVNQWVSFIKDHPEALLYCYRGGQRSQIAQTWIKEVTGQVIPRIEGGYKAMRTYLLNALEPAQQDYIPVILGGNTGAGKTTILNQLKNVVDLEGIANHRGSSFGGYLSPQPVQHDFENNLAYALIKQQDKGYQHLILENEGSKIGRSIVYKPLALFFNSGPLVVVEQSLDKRVTSITKEYVLEAQDQYYTLYAQEGQARWKESISMSLSKITNRLGLERYKNIQSLFENACKVQETTGDTRAHRDWVELLLTQYYDPMYQYQLGKSEKKIIFKGNHEDVLAFLRTMT